MQLEGPTSDLIIVFSHFLFFFYDKKALNTQFIIEFELKKFTKTLLFVLT